MEGGSVEECDLDVAGENVEGEEPALAFDAIERGVPFDGFADFGDFAGNEGVEFTAEGLFPAGHRLDVGLDGGVAVGLGDLRVSAGEEGGFLWGGHGAATSVCHGGG